MKLQLFCYCLLITTNYSFAWLPPERCAQSKTLLPDAISTPIQLTAKTTTTADELASKQHADLKRKYEKYKFFGVPARITCDEPFRSCNFNNWTSCLGKMKSNDDASIALFAPYDCQFYTYDPVLLSSVSCHSNECKLSHTVTTVDTYTPTEGYNWGVTIYGKASFFDFFEVGGEASTGGAYSCTYTKGKTTSDHVECSVAQPGELQLYNVKSDMQCKFGSLDYFVDWDRDWDGLDVSSNTFTHSEATKINQAKLDLDFEECLMSMYMLDMDKISEGLLEKLMEGLPKYDPFSDAITMHKVGNGYKAVVIYLKHGRTVYDLKKVIPFTTKAGNSVYQYACLHDPL
ncbi:hypothetical protein D1Q00_gp062 [Trichoplusia ni granulovirus LBIV-12]|jgi:hypothetical protein|uniref:Uncharacterized protein n=1 Tax=Trichoplusia ni granulovirus LBIV-12 TaxID=1916701 RepID=A0A1D8QL62_GVTN|nr:hypothetical protein D1Q00_gp062 [Trichoplusia ni granulovirus LBIV-12]AOW41401.1 hypothetical protein [Trichoplusia ni granulovirus LBIV-12]